MKEWKYTLNIKTIWNKTVWTNDNIPELGKLIADKIKKTFKDYHNYDKWGFGLEEIVEGFESISSQEEWDSINEDNYNYAIAHGEEPLSESNPSEEFNNLMSELYDFADSNSIWVKTQG